MTTAQRIADIGTGLQAELDAIGTAIEGRGGTWPAEAKFRDVVPAVESIDVSGAVAVTLVAGDEQVDVTQPTGETRRVWYQLVADDPDTDPWSSGEDEIPFSITGLTNDTAYRFHDGVGAQTRTPESAAAAPDFEVLGTPDIQTGANSQDEHKVVVTAASEPIAVMMFGRGTVVDFDPDAWKGAVDRDFGTGTGLTRTAHHAQGGAASPQVSIFLDGSPGSGALEYQAQPTEDAYGSALYALQLPGVTGLGTAVVGTSSNNVSSRPVTVTPAAAGQKYLLFLMVQNGSATSENNITLDIGGTAGDPGTPVDILFQFDTSYVTDPRNTNSFNMRAAVTIWEAPNTSSAAFWFRWTDNGNARAVAIPLDED